MLNLIFEPIIFLFVGFLIGATVMFAALLIPLGG